jgi:hypothetical protein
MQQIYTSMPPKRTLPPLPRTGGVTTRRRENLVQRLKNSRQMPLRKPMKLQAEGLSDYGLETSTGATELAPSPRNLNPRKEELK